MLMICRRTCLCKEVRFIVCLAAVKHLISHNIKLYDKTDVFIGDLEDMSRLHTAAVDFCPQGSIFFVFFLIELEVMFLTIAYIFLSMACLFGVFLVKK